MKFKIGNMVRAKSDYSHVGFPKGEVKMITSLSPCGTCVRSEGRDTGICETAVELVATASHSHLSPSATGQATSQGGLPPPPQPAMGGAGMYTPNPWVGAIASNQQAQPPTTGIAAFLGEPCPTLDLNPMPMNCVIGVQPAEGCDCGGKKTYGLVSKETCSSWCSAQRIV